MDALKKLLPAKVQEFLRSNYYFMVVYRFIADRTISRYIKRYMFRLCVDIGIFPLFIGVNKVKIRKHKIYCSLTSYGRRVDLVHYTIVSLLMQSCKPDNIILWLDSENWSKGNIPRSLQRLHKYGLTIKFCDDIKSYKKLVPMLKEDQDAIIVTADDDMFYPYNWFRGLVDAYERNPVNIYCYRADKINLAETGYALTYRQWDLDTKDEIPSHLIMPVGSLGVLYPPWSLHKDTIDRNMFEELCPHSDDIWFWTMSVRNDVKKAIVRSQGFRGKRKRPHLFELYDTCQDKLANYNVLSFGNDASMSAVIARFRLASQLKLEYFK